MPLSIAASLDNSSMKAGPSQGGALGCSCCNSQERGEWFWAVDQMQNAPARNWIRLHVNLLRIAFFCSYRFCLTVYHIYLEVLFWCFRYKSSAPESGQSATSRWYTSALLPPWEDAQWGHTLRLKSIITYKNKNAQRLLTLGGSDVKFGNSILPNDTGEIPFCTGCTRAFSRKPSRFSRIRWTIRTFVFFAHFANWYSPNTLKGAGAHWDIWG